jgi:hypothetical protein
MKKEISDPERAMPVVAATHRLKKPKKRDSSGFDPK